MSPTKPPRVRAVPAVTRAFAILRLLARSRAPLPLKTIAESLDLVPSTALHILRALVVEGMIQVDPPTKRYRLGVDVLTLARAVLEYSDFPNLVRPKLDEISRRHQVTALATEVPNLDHMVVVALASGPGPVRVHVDIGSRLPALITATGRCVAAYSDYPWEEIERRFKLLRWDNGPTYENWVKEVELTRRHGYSVDRRNYIAGLTLVAAPVLNASGHITHTLAAIGLSSQLNRDSVLTLGHEMRHAAREIGDRMAGQA